MRARGVKQYRHKKSVRAGRAWQQLERMDVASQRLGAGPVSNQFLKYGATLRQSIALMMRECRRLTRQT